MARIATTVTVSTFIDRDAWEDTLEDIGIGLRAIFAGVGPFYLEVRRGIGPEASDRLEDAMTTALEAEKGGQTPDVYLQIGGRDPGLYVDGRRVR